MQKTSQQRSDEMNQVPQPIRDGLGASILGPHNVPVERENPDLLASPYTDNGTIPNLKFSFATARNRLVKGGWAFKIPGVVADALTATLITLGQRLAQDLDHPGPQSQEWRWSSMLMVLLCLIYVASALVVALTSAFMLTPVVPVIVVTIAICALLVPSRQATRSLPTSSS